MTGLVLRTPVTRQKVLCKIEGTSNAPVDLPILGACNVSGFLSGITTLLLLASTSSGQWKDYPPNIQLILQNTRPLDHPRGKRLPLLLWPVLHTEVEDASVQERIIRDLDTRGVAMIASWDGADRQASLAKAMRIARIQKKLGLPVCINANACMYGFFDGSSNTAHLDESGKSFFDASIPGHKIGCPFRIDHRYDKMREKIDYFVRAYHEVDLPIDFVFGDWEVDGPLEVNHNWESSRRCVVCQKNIPQIKNFDAYQEAVRRKRSEATRMCYSKPILTRYPKALVGNYGVYPHDGYRYWYDYFEKFVDYHPHRKEQRARYRKWFNEFPLTGYTFAMPVYYPRSEIFQWYNFPNTDYRWFYGMLKVASNAGQHTDTQTSIIPFVHWHPIFEGRQTDPSITPLSKEIYQELLWHALMRGSDTFFMWCFDHEKASEVQLVHQVWAESLPYARWLSQGRPVTFEVPAVPQTVVSGVRLGNRVLVRRTDFDPDHSGPLQVTWSGGCATIPANPGKCQIITLK